MPRSSGQSPQTLQRTPFIGRDEELELLRSVYGRAMGESSVQLASVIGEPGVGKTRLIREFLGSLERRSEPFTWRRGRCLPYGVGVSFWALGEIVKAHAGILESDGPTTAREKLVAAVRGEISDPVERDWLLPRMAPLAGLAGPEFRAEMERTELFTAWQRFLEAIASTAPLILVLEDMHWADGPLFEFVEHLADWSSGVPLMILCAARPELYVRNATWGGGKRSSLTLELPALTKEETGRLIATLVPTGLPEATQAALIDRAAGIPLYAEQFASMLADHGPAEEGGEAPHTTVPGSLRSLLSSRLASLPRTHRALLRDASVVGKVFWTGAVAALGGVDEAEVRESMRRLARQDLVRPARSSSVGDQEQYSFWHSLIRDVAYAEIPLEELAGKHAAAGLWIEGLGSAPSDAAEILVHHYARALELLKDHTGVPGEGRSAASPLSVEELEDRTATYLIMAGDRALQLDVPRALGYYDRALDLRPPGHPERAAILARAAEATSLSGDFVDAVARYQEVIDSHRAAGRRVEQAESMLRLGYTLWNQGWTARARELLDEAVQLLEREPPGPELALAYVTMAGDRFFGGQSSDALRWSQRALDLSEQLGLEELRARTLEVRGMARCDLGDWDGLADLRGALHLALDLGLGQETVRAYLNLGTFVTPTEGPAKALDLYRSAISFAGRRGITMMGMWVRAWSLGVLFELGRWDELVEDARAAAAWERDRGPSQFVVGALLCQAEVLVYRGDVDGARALAAEFLPRARDVGDPQVLLPALAVAALIADAAGDAEQAAALVDQFDRESRDRAPWVRTLFLLVVIEVLVATGRIERARELLQGADVATARGRASVLACRALLAETDASHEEAAGLYEEAAAAWAAYGFVLQRGFALLGRGRCLLALGRTDEGETTLREAAGLFEGLGARLGLAEVDVVFSGHPRRDPSRAAGRLI